MGGIGPVDSGQVPVIQADPFNASRIATVIVAAITSNLALAEAPGNVRIGKTDSGLPQPSVVNVSPSSARKSNTCRARSWTPWTAG